MTPKGGDVKTVVNRKPAKLFPVTPMKKKGLKLWNPECPDYTCDAILTLDLNRPTEEIIDCLRADINLMRANIKKELLEILGTPASRKSRNMPDPQCALPVYERKREPGGKACLTQAINAFTTLNGFMLELPKSMRAPTVPEKTFRKWASKVFAFYQRHALIWIASGNSRRAQLSTTEPVSRFLIAMRRRGEFTDSELGKCVYPADLNIWDTPRHDEMVRLLMNATIKSK